MAFLGLYEVFVFTRRPLWFMIFGGVFDRHPDLRVVVTENGVQWLPRSSATWSRSSTPTAERRCAPTSRCDRSSTSRPHVCLGGSLMKRYEAEMRQEIGIERLMWGADYPHLEGRPGRPVILRQVFGGCPKRTSADLRRQRRRAVRLRRRQLQAVADRAVRPVADLPTPLSWTTSRDVQLELGPSGTPGRPCARFLSDFLSLTSGRQGHGRYRLSLKFPLDNFVGLQL